ncbi:MAG: DUF4179 domain-containing protein [Clostridium sp.]|uniref:DUF4179 domain-containing protein n=1 Tax=Clostridium sp. TaxID=1506 RepID=UPI003D6D0CB9
MKDIYELLNYAEIGVEEFDETSLDDIYKKKLKKRLHQQIKIRGNNFGKTLKVAAVVLSIISLTAFVSFKINPTFATGIPVVGSIIKNITGYGNEEFDKYTSVINKTIEKDGLKVTLNEIMLDDNQLRIAATFKSDKNMESKIFSTHIPEVFIDGKKINFLGASGVSENIDDYTCVTVNTIEVHDIKIPYNMDMKVVYENIRFTTEKGEEQVVKGVWEFKVNISKEEIQTKTKNIKINKRVKYKNIIDMDIKDIRITPLTMNVYFKLRGENQLSFIIRDDKGRELRQESSSCGSDGLLGAIGNYTKGHISFSGVPQDSKKLTIIPYYEDKALKYEVIENNKTEHIKYNNNLPVILKQNNENKIIIHKIERKDGKVYVEYKTEGISCEMQKYRLYLYDSNKKLLERIYDEGNIGKVNNSDDMIIGVFKASENGDIYLGTDNMKDIQVVKDEEFTVDLNN